jgi:hypothetical protein
MASAAQGSVVAVGAAIGARRLVAAGCRSWRAHVSVSDSCCLRTPPWRRPRSITPSGGHADRGTVALLACPEPCLAQALPSGVERPLQAGRSTSLGSGRLAAPGVRAAPYRVRRSPESHDYWHVLHSAVRGHRYGPRVDLRTRGSLIAKGVIWTGKVDALQVVAPGSRRSWIYRQEVREHGPAGAAGALEYALLSGRLKTRKRFTIQMRNG